MSFDLHEGWQQGQSDLPRVLESPLDELLEVVGNLRYGEWAAALAAARDDDTDVSVTLDDREPHSLEVLGLDLGWHAGQIERARISICPLGADGLRAAVAVARAARR